MLSFFKDYKYFAIVFACLCLIIITIFYNIFDVYKPLPIYQPAMVNTEMVDSMIQYKKKYHKIADFSLINKYVETITAYSYNNKNILCKKTFTYLSTNHG